MAAEGLIEQLSDDFFFPLILLDDLFKLHKAKPPLKWRQLFENYLKTMPPYYIGVSGFYFLVLSNLKYFCSPAFFGAEFSFFAYFSASKKSTTNDGSSKPHSREHGIWIKLQHRLLSQKT